MIIGLPLGQRIPWRKNRERTSPQDALMVAFILPVDSCTAVGFLTGLLEAQAQNFKALCKDTSQASAEAFEPLPMFWHSVSENAFLVLSHAENG